MPDTEGKYVVFKREEWNEFEEKHVGPVAIQDLPRQLSDCVVIRHDDVFAATAFYSYAGAVTGAMEVMDHFPGAKELEGQLRDTADFFMAQAERAELTPNKHLPKGQS